MSSWGRVVWEGIASIAPEVYTFTFWREVHHYENC
jgi:hypothetical protein